MSTGPKVRKKLKKKQVKKDPTGFGSIFASTALPGFARAFSKLVGQGYSAAEAVKIMKNKE